MKTTMTQATTAGAVAEPSGRPNGYEPRADRQDVVDERVRLFLLLVTLADC